ncbi:MAG: VWA domain-containing protein, partial [Planctomycetota bacterium]|nr:VWA domain-containing protein [Planctomycetota bacterium]
ERGSDPAPTPDREAFGIPMASRRIWFVLCSRWTIPDRDTLIRREDPAKARFERMRDAITDAIDALPGDAEFNVLHGESYGSAAWFSKRMVRAQGTHKARARAWLEKRAPRYKAGMLSTLYDAIRDYDARSFAALPDTIVVLAAGHGESDAEDSPLWEVSDRFLNAFALWNLPAGVVVHAVGFGDDIHRDALACLALQSGGAFRSDKQSFPAAIPMPAGDRVEAPRVLREAFRSDRLGNPAQEHGEWENLATIGEAAYPLKSIVTGYLDDEHPEWLRIAALRVLGGIGPHARDVLPRVEELVDDESDEVSAAAKNARDAIRG